MKSKETDKENKHLSLDLLFFMIINWIALMSVLGLTTH